MDDPDLHKPHHHIEHVHRDERGKRDHRREEDCPGDEDGEVVEPDFTAQSGNHVPTPPPPDGG